MHDIARLELEKVVQQINRKVTSVDKQKVAESAEQEAVAGRRAGSRKAPKATFHVNVYGPLVEFALYFLKNPKVLKSLGLCSESDLMNVMFAIFKELYHRLGQRLSAYLPDIARAIRNDDFETARRYIEAMIADAFKLPAQCPPEVLKLYSSLRTCIPDLDIVLRKAKTPEVICEEVYALLAGERGLLDKKLEEILDELRLIREKVEKLSHNARH